MRLKGLLKSKLRAGTTLSEMVMTMALTGMTVGVMVQGFVLTSNTAESSCYVLAAQQQALERHEEVKAAKWDPNADPPIDQVQQTNFPVVVRELDVPQVGKKVFATNYTTIKVVSVNPPLKTVRIQTVWPWIHGKVFTNSVETFRGPDQ